MGSSAIRRPAESEHAPYYGNYVSQVPEGDFFALLEQQTKETLSLLRGISEQKSEFRYAPGKWSIREVIGHVADAERVFAYRALRAARRDAAELPGFDENVWASQSNAHQRTLASLLDEFAAARASTLALFRGFDEGAWTQSVVASKNPVTVRALAYIIAGHERHHVKILKERYLKQ